MKSSLTGLLLVLLTTLLAACGFQLRGTGSDAFALRELDLKARNAYGDTVKDVRRALENSGVRVHGGAPYQLVLVGEGQKQRTASYTSAARSAEYEMTANLAYEIRGNQLTLLRDQVATQKVYVHDSNNLAGTDQEAERVRTEMRRELVQQLLLRLQQLSPAQLAELQETAQAKAEAEAKAAAAARQAAPATPAR
ncbi:LPS-assembly lipoprotein LptE [Pseudomonas oryzae]|uniref:LPS-assembly lipoprotein LptE n=1 Tax=Pseudomonas oryzae TaxID=1392877 RepID=A0A1H1Z836_9PSED|nr:LPS assembly lipoprotein LptE [Pseudomonas oryzae]SDT29803.1 LPS-assembly lipoprotein [Pseudomonas oryzae]